MNIKLVIRTGLKFLLSIAVGVGIIFGLDRIIKKKKSRSQQDFSDRINDNINKEGQNINNEESDRIINNKSNNYSPKVTTNNTNIDFPNKIRRAQEICIGIVALVQSLSTVVDSFFRLKKRVNGKSLVPLEDQPSSYDNMYGGGNNYQKFNFNGNTERVRDNGWNGYREGNYYSNSTPDNPEIELPFPVLNMDGWNNSEFPSRYVNKNGYVAIRRSPFILEPIYIDSNYNLLRIEDFENYYKDQQMKRQYQESRFIF